MKSTSLKSGGRAAVEQLLRDGVRASGDGYRFCAVDMVFRSIVRVRPSMTYWGNKFAVRTLSCRRFDFRRYTNVVSKKGKAVIYDRDLCAKAGRLELGAVKQPGEGEIRCRKQKGLLNV